MNADKPMTNAMLSAHNVKSCNLSSSNDNNQKDDYDDDGLEYFAGFGNEFESSCWSGALPIGRNNPRHVPYGLYTEQLSGTAFTKPRSSHNKRTWLYRQRPSVSSTTISHAKPLFAATITNDDDVNNNHKAKGPLYFGHTSPNNCQPVVDPLRWHPRPTVPETADKNVSNNGGNRGTTFVEGCHLMCHGGSVEQKHGLAIYVYEFDKNMLDEKSILDTNNKCMYNADGEFLIVPQQGMLEIVTELGKLRVRPKEIAVIPRGVVFSVQWLRLLEPSSSEEPADDEKVAKGYMLEVYGGDGFQLPELGPIGANGLANARDFKHPKAWCSPSSTGLTPVNYTITTKMLSRLFERESDHSPYNVVAWHGNYLPYKYNLDRFCVVNSVSYDHLDPSIFTVLTCPSYILPGTALADFVIFPPRFMATDDNTFRPPYFHRNTMSEYMGLICGQYDGKPTKGNFVPGGASLHNCMTPHGPDRQAYQNAVGILDGQQQQQQPQRVEYFDKGLAFMFESYLTMTVAPSALEDETWRDWHYAQASWHGFEPSSSNHDGEGGGAEDH
ncbi:hypothetical protein ACA910_000314 [Epithemia clementina (nom. ined.)]